MSQEVPTFNNNPLSYETFNENILDRSLGATEYTLNGQLHEIQIFITNGSQIYSLAPTAIVELSIEETIADWVKKGTLTIYNANELTEIDGYIFRNDGEDLLRIRIVPRDLDIKGLPSLNIKTNRNLWEINDLFSIYNVEDVTPPTGGNTDSKKYKKFKKFYFWDIRYQIMSTRNIEYSTALSQRAPINTSSSLSGIDTTTILTDENRSIPSGIAIDEIIKASLDSNPILARTGLDTTDPEKYWDTGGRTIFYTSGASDNCFEDLEYLKSRHISSIVLETGMPDYCLLSTERSSDGLSFFTLTPFSKIFSRAGSDQPGEDQIEHFFLHADAKEETQGGIPMYRAPRNTNLNSTRDITLRDFSFITSYELTDISPIVNAGDFISYSVHSFDFARRQFNIEFKNHNFITAQNLFQNRYIDKLYTNGKSSGNNFLLDIQNNSKLNNLSVMPVFNVEGDSTKPEIRAVSGLYKLLHTGLFQNTCINFTVPGLTLRQAGKFIGIDRPEGSLDNTFDNKLCGQWYVINVLHTISNGAYYNNITAIKIHRHKPTTLAQRTTEKFVNRFAGPNRSLQDLLFSGSNQLSQ